MQFRRTNARNEVLATVMCVVDAPLLKLMEQDYQPAGTSESADWWQTGKGCIRYRQPESIVIGTLIRASAIKIVRPYTEKECRMIVIELEDGLVGKLKTRTPEELAIRVARFMGACSGIIDEIKSRWSDENEVL